MSPSLSLNWVVVVIAAFWRREFANLVHVRFFSRASQVTPSCWADPALCPVLRLCELSCWNQLSRVSTRQCIFISPLFDTFGRQIVRRGVSFLSYELPYQRRQGAYLDQRAMHLNFVALVQFLERGRHRNALTTRQRISLSPLYFGCCRVLRNQGAAFTTVQADAPVAAFIPHLFFPGA